MIQIFNNLGNNFHKQAHGGKKAPKEKENSTLEKIPPNGYVGYTTVTRLYQIQKLQPVI